MKLSRSLGKKRYFVGHDPNLVALRTVIFTLDGVFDKNLGPALAVRYIKTNAEKQNSFLTRFVHLLNIITLCI